MDEEIEFLDKRDAKLDAIKTRDDLVDYLEFMAWAYRRGYMEEQSPADYLDGAAGIIEALDAWLGHMDLPPAEEQDWKLFGRILTGAFAHS